MIKVELSDFQVYRSRLLEYAMGLLKTRGSAKTLYSDYKDKAEDIVQECYLVFHKCNLNAFVTEEHLWNYLKLCLYRKYQESIDSRRKDIQYSLFKKSDVESLNLEEHYGDNKYLNDNSCVEDFLQKLTIVEKEMMIKLLEGFTHKEIMKILNLNLHRMRSTLDDIKSKYLGSYKSSNEAKVNRTENCIKLSKKVMQLDMSDKFIKEWDSGAIAAYELDLSASAISNCCKNKRTSHGKFKWKFKEETNESTGSKM